MPESERAQAIETYWNVQPPYRASNASWSGSSDWYKSISQHRYQVIEYIRSVVQFEQYRGKRVLEVGCGAGTDLAEFARCGAIATGIDITARAVELAGERLRVEGLQGEVLPYDGRRLPFPDGTFDLVYSWGVLHHTPYMDELLSEAYRVLKVGGELQMMLYHSRSLLYYYSILYLRGFKGTEPYLTRDELISKYSEFRVGCPFTRCYAANEIKDKLWYFASVSTSTEYCVYDTLTERKKLGNHLIQVEKTRIADIDLFFEEFNRAVHEGKDLRRYGWHLIVKALK